LFDSCHPKHTKNYISYDLARRLCTIISDTEIVDIRLAELKSLFLQRRYQRELIEKGIRKAKSHERKDPLTEKNKSAPVTTYNSKNSDFSLNG
jgi:hypothetical protein